MASYSRKGSKLVKTISGGKGWKSGSSTSTAVCHWCVESLVSSSCTIVGRGPRDSVARAPSFPLSSSRCWLGVFCGAEAGAGAPGRGSEARGRS